VTSIASNCIPITELEFAVLAAVIHVPMIAPPARALALASYVIVRNNVVAELPDESGLGIN